MFDTLAVITIKYISIRSQRSTDFTTIIMDGLYKQH